jgi:hypothetical protein
MTTCWLRIDRGSILTFIPPVGVHADIRQADMTLKNSVTIAKLTVDISIVVEMGTASFTEDPIWWAGGSASGESVAAVVSCLDGAVSACEGGNGDGAGTEAGEGKGGSDGKGDIESIVVMAGGISCVFCVIHLSVGVLGAVLLLVGVEGVR